MSKIVVTGGGTGMGNVLRSLLNKNHNLSALVSMIASGGSTGRLRYDLGVHPVGTVRQALVALSNVDEITYKAINYRFTEGELKGHNAGNFYLAVFEKVTGSLEKAIEIATERWNVSGNVIPLTKDAVDVCVTLENGDLICGEKNIDTLNFNKDAKITDLFLDPNVVINEKALEAIKNAEYIIFGPGDFYFLLSSFFVEGFIKAVNESFAKKIFVCNILNRYGITTNFTVKDYVNKIETYLGEGCLDYIICNNENYKNLPLANTEIKDDETFVIFNKNDFKDKKVIILERDLVCETIYVQDICDEAHRSSIRHDIKKLGNALSEIIK